ncbi:6-deoxyerythronolide-B synthase [Sulfurifustis variabilis]|uniref:6-deoxyerythronolide-B synthase n=1 Tax=Sulfurifustis variabilis TaxID=1675686 RepID=A0A1B4V4X9_9GAMM|nr:6-deoxyerythronolide-B synthase [Sulfurifustis variabilis]
MQRCDGEIGLLLTGTQLSLAASWLESLADRPHWLLVSSPDVSLLPEQLKTLPRASARRLLVEVTDVDTALALTLDGIDGFVAKGHEAGGWVGEDMAFILCQKLLALGTKPVYVRGGIGVHTVAACRAAGAAGAVLDDQLLLMPESFLPAEHRRLLESASSLDTVVIGETLQKGCRVYRRPGLLGVQRLQEMALECECDEPAAWRAKADSRLGWGQPDDMAWPIGQAVGFAARFRDRYKTTGRLIQAMRASADRSPRAAAETRPLAPEAALATSHGTTYPIVQGAMTRVSDTVGFAHAVAEAGALPFLALAMMRREQATELLRATRDRLGERPWGVGVLGFVSHSLREEQMQAIREVKPPFALIAGGRPDQAAAFEREGIATYLHVPAPNLLRLFLEQGARRFIFEGRECGGHIGPLASFVLWEQMTDVLLEDVSAEIAPQVHVLFAGGVHDARSSAMVAALAAPLAERGIRVGVLMGTAYLFTREAVESKAIGRSFQEQLLACRHTAGLETGPGHSTRCAVTPFVHEFFGTRRRLLKEGRSHEEIRDELENLNLGRLRLASKGVRRGASGEIEMADDDTRVREGMYMVGQVATQREQVVGIRDLHEDVSVNGTAWLAKFAGKPAATRAASRPADIAIIGMGTLLPRAHAPETYWRNIVEKVKAIVEVPPHRWDWRLYYSADRHARDKVYSKWGGFLEDVPFDPLRFGIPPNSLKSIDPVQLLALEVVRRALEHAGYADAEFDREHTAIVLGASGGLGDIGQQYGVRAEMPRFVDSLSDEVWDRLPEWTEESFAGSLLNVVAGRVANRFNFGGMNLSVDAACASSLAAIYTAVNELESGRCNMAIAGGVDTVQGPYAYMCFSKTQALSPRGEARTFDKDADGIVISEGLAVVVLKRLADAERDGDRIYGVIKAVGSSSDGKALGLTAPLPAGQVRALRRAYDKAGFSPRTLGMLEAHGTGTAVGDSAEAQTVVTLLREHEAPARSCALGSVKTLIGHTKASAGAAGLIKTMLSLHHKVLPPHAGVEQPIASIADRDSPVYLLKNARPWLRDPEYPRRAGVSAFGFGGTNFHVVLEEYDGDLRPSARPAGGSVWPAELFVFGAPNRGQLAKEIQALHAGLSAGGEPRLHDLAYACARKAEAAAGARCMAAIVAKTREELIEALTALSGHLAGAGPLPGNVHLGLNLGEAAPKVAFLFPGQGSQYVDMGREAALYLDELRSAFEFADGELRSALPKPLSQFVYPVGAFSESEENEHRAALTNTAVAQPAIGAMALGFMRLAARLGIAPDMAGGHSYGEYAALCAGGALSPKDFLALSAVRGRVMASAAGTGGGMAAVQAPREEVARRLEGQGDVVIANHNAPRQSVISGPKERVQQLAAEFTAAGITAQVLPVSAAFHSSMLASAQEPLAAAIRTSTVESPRVPVYGNRDGTPYPADPKAIRDRLADHLLSPVEFVRQVEAMHRDGARVFVELGPKNVLTRLVSQVLAGRDFHAVSFDSPGAGLAGVLTCLAALAVRGVRFRYSALFEGREVGEIDLARVAQIRHTLPASAWLVNGGSCRRQSEEPGRTGKLPPLNVESLKVAREREAARATVSPPTPSNTEPAPISGPMIAPPAPHQPADGQWSDAFVAYQESMRQFLAVQEQVMRHFLAGPAGVAAMPAGTAVPVPPPMPATRQPASVLMSPAPTTAPLASVPHPAVPPAPSAPSIMAPPSPATATTPDAPARPALADLLVGIVSDRTGYPQDMLGLDQDIEANLGIDSIKRVEILGALQKQLPPTLATRVQSQMERLTRAKTLNAVLDQLVAAGAVEFAAPSAPSVAPIAPASVPSTPATAAPDRAALADLLVQVVSERTGYPQDMLGLDQDIEANLGIDSIKRVEIIGALQKQLPAPLAARMQSQMERLTRAKTLNAVLDQLVSAAAVESAAPSAPSIMAPPSPATATTPDAPARPALADLLVGIVSDRTGYPQDMLGLDQDIEANLGIDSIKRVEILGALQKQLPPTLATRVQSQMERLTRAKTLNAVLDQLVAVAAVETPAPVAAPAVAEAPAAQAETPPMFGMRAVEEPLPSGDESWPQGLVLITEDELGVAARVAGALSAKGARVETLGADAFTDPESLADTVKRARAAHGPVCAIVHLAPLARANTQMDLDGWRTATRLHVKGLFWLLRECSADLIDAAKRGQGAVLAASLMGGQFGRAGAMPGPASGGGACGLLKCVVHEWSGLRAKAVDFDDRLGAEDCSRHVLAELVRPGRLEVGYPGGVRTVFDTVPLAKSAAAPESAPAADWVVLVTGGARGITAEIAEELARFRPTLILAGRSSLGEEEDRETAAAQEPGALRKLLIERAKARGVAATPVLIDRQLQQITGAREIRRNLARCRAAGARVDYRVADVRNEAELVRLLGDIYAAHGRLDAVVHGAGVIEDKFIVDKTIESFDRVFDTKADSGFLLARHLRPDSLKLMVFFTSVAGRYGNRGQSDYAAANEVVNRLAWQIARSCPKAHVAAINWGPWDSQGMASEGVRRQFRSQGIVPIALDAGRRAFVEEAIRRERGRQVEVVVGEGPWARQAAAAASPPANAVLPARANGHTLVLLRSTSRIEKGAMVMEHTFSIETDPYLQDHRLDGKPVLPATMALEWMVQFVQRAWPEWVVSGIQDLRLFRGIVVDGSHGTPVLFRARASSHSDSESFSVSAEILEPNGKLPYYRASVLLAPALPEPPTMSLSPLDTGNALATDRVYRDYLFHGPRFQLLSGIERLNADGIDAVARPSAPAAWLVHGGGQQGAWMFDPGLVDTAPQLAIVWCRINQNTTALPTRFGTVRRYGTAPIKDPLRVAMRVKSQDHGKQIVYDALFVEPDGKVRLEMRDLEGSCSQALNRLAGNS